MPLSAIQVHNVIFGNTEMAIWAQSYLYKLDLNAAKGIQIHSGGEKTLVKSGSFPTECISRYLSQQVVSVCFSPRGIKTSVVF